MPWRVIGTPEIIKLSDDNQAHVSNISSQTRVLVSIYAYALTFCGYDILIHTCHGISFNNM